MKLKKILATVLMTATVVSAMSMGVFAADSKTASKDYNAFLMFSDVGETWKMYNAEDSKETNCKVTGDGTYTVSVNKKESKAKKAANGANVFCVDIPGLAKTIMDSGKVCDNYEKVGDKKVVTIKEDQSKVDVKVDVKVKVDGKEVTVNPDNIVYGNIEDAGTFRIELRNEYGATKDKPAVAKTDITQKDTLEVTFTLAGTGLGTPVTIAPAATAEIPADMLTSGEASPEATVSAQAATSNNTKDDSGLSTGAIVGIVVAVVVVAGIVVFVVVKKKKEN